MNFELSRDFLLYANEKGAFHFGGAYRLNSGDFSPYYFDGQAFFQRGSGLVRGSEILLRAVEDFGIVKEDGYNPYGINAISAPAYGGIQLCLLLAEAFYRKWRLDIDWLYNRKEEKDHGAGGEFVGTVPRKGMRILLVEDAVTRGSATIDQIRRLKRCGAEIACILFLFNREESAFSRGTVSDSLENYFGVPVFSVATVTDLMEFLSERGREKELNEILEYREKKREEISEREDCFDMNEGR